MLHADKPCFLKNTIKIISSLVLVCLFMHLSIGTAGAVTELSIDERLHIGFSDLHQAPWAEPEIKQLTIRGVLGGFPDGTYRPNAPIRKVEALVMAIRTLGLEPEAKEYEKSADSSFFVLQGKGLDWARGYLRASHRNGLITNYVQEVDWYEPADRAWMAQLMVRMIRKVEEARDIQYPLYFQDRNLILPNQQAYVQIVQREGLMSGYPDNTFRPKATMTRAEMAVLFSNYYDKYMMDYTIKKGTYATIQEFHPSTGEIIIRTRDQGIQKYTVHSKAPVFYKPHGAPAVQTLEKRSYQDLKRGQQIDYLLNRGQVIFVTILAEGLGDSSFTPDYHYESGREIYYVGFFKEWEPSNQVIRMETLMGKQERYAILPQVRVEDENGNQRSLAAGRLYRIYFGKDAQGDKAIERLVEQDASRNSYTGDLIMNNTYNSQITVRHGLQESVSFIVAEGMKLGFQQNDYLRVHAYGNYMYDWEVLRPVSDEGYFISYDEERHRIHLLDYLGKEKIYNLDEEPRIQVPQISRANIEDIYKNDYIRLSFDRYDRNQNERYDEVIEIRVVDQLSGTIVSANSSEIRWIDEHGIERKLPLADSVSYSIPNVRQPTMSDLRRTDKAFFQMKSGKIQQVNVYHRNVEEGAVFAIRESASGSKQMILGDNLYSQKNFTIDANTRVQWAHYNNLSLNEVRTGQHVKVWHDGEQAVDIELIDTGTVRGQVVDYGYQSVWLQATGQARSRFILSDSITNIDTYQNKVVELQFQNGKVSTIQTIPTDDRVYTVVHYNLAKQTFWVRDEEGKHIIYWLPEETLLYDGYREPLSVIKDRLSVKSRVKLEVVNETVVAMTRV